MDKITQEVRIANWKSIIEQCHARPEGQSAKQWLADNGISEKSYYYWQRKVRQEAYALMQPSCVVKPEPVVFAELPFDGTKNAGSSFIPSALIHRGGTVFELSNNISDRLLDRLMEVMSHA